MHSILRCTQCSHRLNLPTLVEVLSGFFFFNDTATTEIYTLSLHDALPICMIGFACLGGGVDVVGLENPVRWINATARSEEHTSELQSRPHLVCRLLLEKKKKTLYPRGRRELVRASID